jgi:hypothetical protein
VARPWKLERAGAVVVEFVRKLKSWGLAPSFTNFAVPDDNCENELLLLSVEVKKESVKILPN